jgi:Xaa-Pro aminopeptidase
MQSFENPPTTPRDRRRSIPENQLSASMDRFHSRRENLRATLESDDIAALLVTAPTNVSYLTGFSGDSSVLFLGRERELIISDGRFTTQLAQECPGLEAHIRLPGEEMIAALARILETIGPRRVGLEATSWTIAEYESICEAAPTVSFLGVKGRVEALRQIKDEDEIAAIREAVRFAERAFTMLRAGLRKGERKRRRRYAGRLPAALRGHRSELSADRRGGRPICLAARAPDIDDHDRPGRFCSDRLGSDWTSL